MFSKVVWIVYLSLDILTQIISNQIINRISNQCIISPRRVFGYSLEKYETISDGVFDAIMFRQEGGSCDSRYTCPAMPSL